MAGWPLPPMLSVEQEGTQVVPEKEKPVDLKTQVFPWFGWSLARRDLAALNTQLFPRSHA